MRARLILHVDHEQRLQREPDKEQMIVSGDRRLEYLKKAGFFLNFKPEGYILFMQSDSSISRREGFSKSVYRDLTHVWQLYTHLATSTRTVTHTLQRQRHQHMHPPPHHITPPLKGINTCILLHTSNMTLTLQRQRHQHMHPPPHKQRDTHVATSTCSGTHTLQRQKRGPNMLGR
jgi:hypothetical protein